MAEYVDKAELKKRLKGGMANAFQPFGLVTSYIKVVENMPTIEVVHCYECKYYTEYDWCDLINLYKPANHFCADGERKTPPIVTDEITELNEENNRLFKENEKLKAKLHEIHCISRGSVLEELEKK